MRENKRIIALRMLIAHQDILEFGRFDVSPETQRVDVTAKDSSDCPECGLPIEVGDPIVLGCRRQLFGVVERWIHAVCPIDEALSRIMDVQTSGRAVSHVGRQRRTTRCTDCGQLIPEGALSYEEMLPRRRADGSRNVLLCEGCAVEARR